MQSTQILDFDVAHLTGEHIRVMEKFAKYDKALVLKRQDAIVPIEGACGIETVNMTKEECIAHTE